MWKSWIKNRKMDKVNIAVGNSNLLTTFLLQTHFYIISMLAFCMSVEMRHMRHGDFLSPWKSVAERVLATLSVQLQLFFKNRLWHQQLWTLHTFFVPFTQKNGKECTETVNFSDKFVLFYFLFFFHLLKHIPQLCVISCRQYNSHAI